MELKDTLRITFLALLTLTALGTLQAQRSHHEYRVVARSVKTPELTSASNEVVVYRSLALQFPTAFTPNGDGLNDTFGLVGVGVAEFKMVVVNRWGEIMFETNDPTEKWDGTYEGGEVPTGTYGYEVVAQGHEAGQSYSQGYVMVSR